MTKTQIRMVFGEVTREMPAGVVMSPMRSYDYDGCWLPKGRQSLWFCGPQQENRFLRVTARLAEISHPRDDVWHAAYVQFLAGDMPALTFHVSNMREGSQAGEMLLAPRQGGGIVICASPGLVTRIVVDVTLSIEPRPMTPKEIETEAGRTRAVATLKDALDVRAARDLHAAIWNATAAECSYQDKPFVTWKERERLFTADVLALIEKTGGWWYWDDYGFGNFIKLHEWIARYDAWQAEKERYALALRP